MAILTLPAVTPAKSKVWLRANSQTFTSPLSNNDQTLELLGARWRAVLMWSDLSEAKWRLLTAWQAQMLGAAGRVYIPAFHALAPKGVGTGAPLVNGGSQTGKSLVTDGWTPGTAGILKAGDVFHVDTSAGREMKIVSADVNSDGGGAATITFSPSIRISPPDNGAIVTASPSCVMRMMDDDQGQLSLVPAVLGESFSVDFVETFF